MTLLQIDLQQIQQFILPVGIIVVMYFFMIRPQQQKAKKLKKLRESLVKGSVIITAGGIHGKIVDVQETTVTIDIDHCGVCLSNEPFDKIRICPTSCLEKNRKYW